MEERRKHKNIPKSYLSDRMVNRLLGPSVLSLINGTFDRAKGDIDYQALVRLLATRYGASGAAKNFRFHTGNLRRITQSKGETLTDFKLRFDSQMIAQSDAYKNLQLVNRVTEADTVALFDEVRAKTRLWAGMWSGHRRSCHGRLTHSGLTTIDEATLTQLEGFIKVVCAAEGREATIRAAEPQAHSRRQKGYFANQRPNRRQQRGNHPYQGSEQPAVHLTHSHARKRQGRKPSPAVRYAQTRDATALICWGCGEVGHIKRECRKKPQFPPRHQFPQGPQRGNGRGSGYGRGKGRGRMRGNRRGKGRGRRYKTKPSNFHQVNKEREQNIKSEFTKPMVGACRLESGDNGVRAAGVVRKTWGTAAGNKPAAYTMHHARMNAKSHATEFNRAYYQKWKCTEIPIPLNVFLDTGANTNLIHRKIVTRHEMEVKKLTSPMKCNTAGEGQLTLRKYVTLTSSAKHKGITWEADFFVVEKLPFEVLVGDKFINYAGFSFVQEDTPDFVNKGQRLNEATGPDAALVEFGLPYFSPAVRYMTKPDETEELHRVYLPPPRPAEPTSTYGSQRAERAKATRPAQLARIVREADVSPNNRRKLAAILEKYKDVFAETQFDVGEFEGAETEFKIELKCKADDYRGFTPNRPIRDAEKNAEAKRQLKELLARGLIRRSNSPYASAMLLVRKPHSEEWRLCVDYRFLNQHTVKDRYPIRSIDPMLRRLAKHRLFSSFDVRGGYYHCKVHKDSIKYTAFITPSGLYEMPKMAFGFSNAPAHFQRCMDTTYGEIEGSEIYIDDLILGGATEDEQLRQVEEALKASKERKVKLNAEKCQLLRAQVEFLGHKITFGKISPNEEYRDKVLQMRRPRDKPELLSYLGAVGWLGKFIPRLGYCQTHLAKLRKKNAIYAWDAGCQKDFEKIQQSVKDAKYLHTADPLKDFILFTDASKEAFGATLCQVVETEIADKDRSTNLPEEKEIVDEEKERTLVTRKEQIPDFVPIAYLCGRFSDSENNWTIPEKEMYAVIRAFKKWRHFLLPSFTHVYTDAKDVYYLLKPKRKHEKSRLAKWAISLMEYNFRAIHLAGKLNVMADYLSRYVPNLVCTLNVYTIDAHVHKAVKNARRRCKVTGKGEDFRVTPCLDEMKTQMTTVFATVAEQMPDTRAKQRRVREDLDFHMDPNFPALDRIGDGAAEAARKYEERLIAKVDDMDTPFKSEAARKLKSLLRKETSLAEKLMLSDVQNAIKEDYEQVIIKQCLGADRPNGTKDTTERHELSGAQKKNLSAHRYTWDKENRVIIYLKKQILAPVGVRARIIRKFHDRLEGGHQGMKRTLSTVGKYFYWPGMARDIQQYTQACTSCFAAKADTRGQTTHGLMQKWRTSRVGEIVHMDIVGPLPVTPGECMRYLLTCMDRFSGWVQAFPLDNCTGPSVAVAFLNGWIFQFGKPEKVLSDRGSNFVGEIMGLLARIIGYQPLCTTAYHPEANGKLERFHRTLKERLRCIGVAKGVTYLEDKGQIAGAPWDVYIPAVIFGYNTTINPTIGTSPWRVMYGTEATWQNDRMLKLAVELVNDGTHKEITKRYLEELSKILDNVRGSAKLCQDSAMDRRVDKANEKRQPHKFMVGDIVFLNVHCRRVGNVKKLNPYYDGPFIITKKHEGNKENNVMIRYLKDDTERMANVQKLKKYNPTDKEIQKLKRQYQQRRD